VPQLDLVIYDKETQFELQILLSIVEAPFASLSVRRLAWNIFSAFTLSESQLRIYSEYEMHFEIQLGSY
jgi:hypothetical protein